MSTIDQTFPDSKLQNLNTFSAVLLGVFTVTSFVVNIFLLTTIASSYQLRNTIFYYHVLHVACINLAYTSIHSLLSMLYVSTGEWRLGTFACSLNSFVGELLGIETMYGMTLMTVDRAVALMSISKYESRLTVVRTLVILGVCWLAGIIITFPVLINSIRSQPYKARFFCSIVDNPLGYPLATLIICYVFPMLVALWAIGTVLFRIHKDRMQRRGMLPNRDGDYTDHIMDHRRVQKQMELAKFSVVAFLVYYSLQGPYYSYKFFIQIRNSQSVSDDLGADLEAPDVETVITLMYSLFLVIYPFLTCCFCKEIWKKFQDLICCRKTNVISTGTIVSGSGGYTVRAEYPGNANEITKKEPPETVLHTGNVVTIMSMSDGIHQIRPGRDKPEYADVPRPRNYAPHNHQIGDAGLAADNPDFAPHGEMDMGYDSEGSETFAEADPEKLKVGHDPDVKTTVTAKVFTTELINDKWTKTCFEIDDSPAGANENNNNYCDNKSDKVRGATDNKQRVISASRQSAKSRSKLTEVDTTSDQRPCSSADKEATNVADKGERILPKRSKSESETNRPLETDLIAQSCKPKRNSLGETSGSKTDNSASGHLPPLNQGADTRRKSYVRTLNPNSVPSPANSIKLPSRHRLVPLKNVVPNIPADQKSKSAQDKKSEEKIRKISTSKKI